MYFPNPYSDPALATYMALAYPYQPYGLLPAYAAATAGFARAAMLVPVCAATAWNLALLGLLAGDASGLGKPDPKK